MTSETDRGWTPPPVVAPNIYPVGWRVEDRRALNVYERAKDLTWNPTRLAWDTIDADALDPEERLAVAYHGRWAPCSSTPRHPSSCTRSPRSTSGTRSTG